MLVFLRFFVRGVSETVSTPEAKVASIADDSTARAVALAQGVDQVEERAAMARKEAQRADMTERGLSREQIAAYVGESFSLFSLYCDPSFPPLYCVRAAAILVILDFCFFGSCRNVLSLICFPV